jgi:hypothetical protein
MKSNSILRSAVALAALILVLACSTFAPPASTAVPVSTEANVVPPTEIAATEPPVAPAAGALIRLGPGKFEQPIWLEVLEGEYHLNDGATLLTGSAVGVNTEDLAFVPGLRIEIGESGLVLLGVTYEAGSSLIVDNGGTLVLKDGTAAQPNLPPPGGDAGILYQDDFSTNDKGWDSGLESDEYGSVTREFVDGQLVLTATSTQEYFIILNSVPDFTGADFVLNMDVTVLESTVASGEFSLEFSLREADGISGRHYAFTFYNDATSYGEVWPTGDYDSIIPFWENETNSAIQLEPGVTNAIKIEAIGTTFSVYINGQLIETITNDTILDPGGVSINLALNEPNQTLKIAFDNLVITAAP